MFGSVRYLAFISPVLITIAAIVLTIFSQRVLDQTLLEQGLQQNRSVVAALEGPFEAQLRLLSTKRIPSERAQVMASIDRNLTELMAGNSLVGIGLFDNQGQPLYRSKGLSASASLPPQSLAALLNDESVSQLVSTETEPVTHQVLTWVPWTLQTEDAVLVISADVTELYNHIGRNRDTLAAAAVLLVLLLYAVLLITVRYADKALQHDNVELLQSLTEQRRIKLELEQQVFERTRILEQEINERRQIESNLREKEAYLQAVMANIFNGIVCIDQRGRILSFNPTAERMFGYPQNQVCGEDVALLMPAAYAPMHGRSIKSYLNTGQAGITGSLRELKGLRKDGSEFPIELGVTETRVAGESIFIGTVRDISAQKAAEMALAEARQKYYHQEKLAAIGSLSAGLVHEIGNPIAAISGLLDDICTADAESLTCSAQALSQLQMAQEQVERIIKITRDVSEFATPQTQQQELLDLNNLIGRTSRLMRHDRRFCGVELKLELDNQIPAIYGVGDHLIQVLMNLLVNAVDALAERDEPQPQIVVRSGVTGKQVWFEVSDNGCGMAAEELALAGDLFFTTKAVGYGTGLGLSLCESLLVELGGTMVLQSQPNQGTQVCVTLPIEPSVLRAEVG